MLKGKIAVLYGGGGALGSTAARVFAREGARVFLVARTQEKLDKIAAEIAASDGEVEAAEIDVFDQQAVEKHADAVATKAGGIDIAFNAVSVMHDQGTQLADLSWEEFIRPVDGFLKVQFNTSKAVSRHMGGERPGVIINMSEPGAKLAIGGILGHAVSSAGKEVFTRILAAELGPQNIRVIGIRPHAMIDAPAAGSYTKDVFEQMAAASGLSSEEFNESLAQGTMIKRLPTLAEVAETAAFLASDHARSMTATVVNLTGGATVD
jgi:NAD(P)-dependent dehydrogenase (short-subunit alcohol dehydrogenase family)